MQSWNSFKMVLDCLFVILFSLWLLSDASWILPYMSTTFLFSSGDVYLFRFITKSGNDCNHAYETVISSGMHSCNYYHVKTNIHGNAMENWRAKDYSFWELIKSMWDIVIIVCIILLPIYAWAL